MLRGEYGPEQHLEDMALDGVAGEILLKIYFGCAANSQKAKNLAHNSKVSLTVNLPYTSWNDIRGLSIGGRAERLTNARDVDRAAQLMFEKFPQIARYAPDELEDIVLFCVTPEAISVLDYRKGFGHTDLVKVDV